MITYHAYWRASGENCTAQAESMDKLQALVFGRSYAPSPSDVNYYSSTTTNAALRSTSDTRAIQGGCIGSSYGNRLTVSRGL